MSANELFEVDELLVMEHDDTDDLIREVERGIAAMNCRTAFKMGASLDDLCRVPESYSIHGKSSWMSEAHRIIDEEAGRMMRAGRHEAANQHTAAPKGLLGWIIGWVRKLNWMRERLA